MVKLLHALAQRLNSQSDALSIMRSVINSEPLLCRREPTDAERAQIEALAARVEKGEMLAYVLGSAEFMSLPFLVTKDVLIPRQDTETLVEAVLEAAPRCARVLDLCCGSGCIGVSLAHFRRDLSVTMADISPKAMEIAAKNAERARVRVPVIKLDALGALGEWDVIVSNPPYIESEFLKTLDVSRHEPMMALDGGADGLTFYRAIVKAAAPLLAFEIGSNQGAAVSALCEEAGRDAKIIRDSRGLDRVIISYAN